MSSTRITLAAGAANPNTVNPDVARASAAVPLPAATADEVAALWQRLPPAPEDTPRPRTTPTPPLLVPLPAPEAPEASDTGAKVPDNEPLRETVRRLGLPLPLPSPHITVLKSRRRLQLWSGKTLVKTYRVALGANPVGHKGRQGDGRTPEGHFYICTRNSSTSAFHIFLGLSYPALPDATRAVQKKAISPREYMMIRQRLASRGAPLWSTRLGGWVGIHGGSDGSFAQRKARERHSPDWTAGCIALKNVEIAELHAATRLGSPVWVQP